QSTPFLNKIANEGVLFNNTMAASPWTLPSHMSILTGMHPIEHGVRSRKFSLNEKINLVSNKYQKAEYATAGFFSAPFRHPVWGFHRGFDTYAPGADYLGTVDAAQHLSASGKGPEVQVIHHKSHTDAETGAQVVDRAINWLEKDDNYTEPFFLLLKFWDPHNDYAAPQKYVDMFHPDFAGEVDGSELVNFDLDLSAEQAKHLKALYEAEIRYTDDQLARFFQQLTEWGIENDVIIAIVSDHGDAFLEHDERGHHLSLYDEVMRVPMMIRAPGLIPEQQLVKGSVSITDLAPTLLDLSNLEPFQNRSGKSMRPLWENTDENYQVTMDLLRPTKKIEYRGYRNGDMKGILDSFERTLTLLNLGEDPLELNPQVVKPNSDVPFARETIEFIQMVAGQRGPRPGLVSETAEMTNLLSELGYTED
ncbi:MAG: sulfatase, partial [Planctomycetota bacterium]|nr:sulfatase [Planctomycetota bacterium]